MRAVALGMLLAVRLMAGTAADVARAIRENSFDHDECYRVRDLTLVKEDVRIYLTEGHLIFSKPVAGRRIAAVMKGNRLGNFDLIYDPGSAEQIVLGQLTSRQNRTYFDTWASFPSKSARQNKQPAVREMELRDYRIESTVNADLSMDLVTRV